MVSIHFAASLAKKYPDQYKIVWLPTIKVSDLLSLKTELKFYKTRNQEIFKTGVSGARSNLFRREDQRRVLFLSEALSPPYNGLYSKNLSLI